MLPEYPLNVYTSTYRAHEDEKINTLAEIGSSEKWTDLVKYLTEHKEFINHCRLPVDNSLPSDLCTPLHYAAKGGAPKEVFGELVKLGASKTLKDGDGHTAFDIGKSKGLRDDILKFIEVPKEILGKESEIQKLESGLHKVILDRADNLITRNGQQLPQVVFLFEFGDFRYALPGTFGGFYVSQHEDGIHVESRISVEKGQRYQSVQHHVIGREGNVELVDETFV